MTARTLGEKLSKELKASFVVENRSGAPSTMAADMTAQTPADGHTLLLA